ncbi:M4 family metallopeptidase [Pseudoalteromonas rubra]|uniref:Peptidase n=1 Tax=Pseudoalteromonas rubra TaxID=43658 RepID=A0A0U3HY10_9GAMM|nr:M4 family metallopeptidase [Pseudoalteromonas rubra]ALU45960.1 hypothetical protein AT705_23865 [Pseudoalteromonas rubra]
MKRLGTILGAGSIMLCSTHASALIESHALLNQQHLWTQLPTTAHAQAPDASLLSAHSHTRLSYQLEKVVGEQPQYEHYQAYFQGIPVLDSRLVVVRNKQGKIIQSMGKLLSGPVHLVDLAAQHKIDLLRIASELYAGKQPEIDSTSKAYLISQGKLLSVTVLQVRHNGLKEQLVIDNSQGTLIRRQSSVSFFTSPNLNGYVAGGGIGGNDKLGAICYSPRPDSMQACTAYRFDEYTPIGKRLMFSDKDPGAIFAQFDGYPLVVKKEQDICRLENPYLTTFDARNNDTQAASYACGSNNENFDSVAVDDNFYTWFSYDPATEAHFNAGLVMQYFHKQLARLYPSQSSNCAWNGYCIKPLKQKVHSNTIHGPNMAFWDGEYVNYGSGDGYYFYSQATLGIAAHEIAHAITSWNAGIGPEGVDGAINEGFSDLATIAVLDYFQSNASGSYTQSEAFTKQFNEQPGQYNQNRKWWFGWGAIYEDQAVRFYELPSWDGTSIDHATDFSLAKTPHANGGVLRKAFYELVKTKEWSIQDAFKVFLRANTSGCMYSTMSLDEFGYCVVAQAPHINISNKSAIQRKDDITDVLLGVGIVADNSLSTLEANTQISYNEISYDISHLNIDSIEKISAQWGDGTSDEWHQGDNQSIYPYLQQAHQVPDGTLARAVITVELSGEDTRSAYRHFFSRPANVSCPPYLNTSKVHTSTLKVTDHNTYLTNGEYTSLVEHRIPLARKRSYTLTFDKDLSGKKLTVLYDINKNGQFDYTEKLVGDATISGNTATFELNSNIPQGIGLMRVAISDVKYSFIHSCGVVDDGQVIDLMIDADAPNLPVIADFSYQLLDDNRIKFTNNSTANQVKQPVYRWNFGFNNQTSNDENPTIQFPQDGATFTVSLTTRYQDGSDSDTTTQTLILQPVSGCSAHITEPANADVFYIDKLTFKDYTGVLHTVDEVSGFNTSGYTLTTLNDFSHTDNSVITIVGSTNLLPRSTIDRLYENNQIGARFSIWLDKNQDGKYSHDEGHFGTNDYNYDYTATDCQSGAGNIEYCRITSARLIRLPAVKRGKTHETLTLRTKFEENPQYPLKQDACKSFTYGEVEDIQFKITRR